MKRIDYEHYITKVGRKEAESTGRAAQVCAYIGAACGVGVWLATMGVSSMVVPNGWLLAAVGVLAGPPIALVCAVMWMAVTMSMVQADIDKVSK